MKSKKLISLFLSALIFISVFTTLPVCAITRESNSVGATYSGTTGDCTWKYDDTTNTLTISGNGAMGDYIDIVQPWRLYVVSIEHVDIRSGVTYIGKNAFDQLHHLKSVNISDSVKNIGECAFWRCVKLTKISVDVNNKYFTSVDGNLYSKKIDVLIQYAIGKNSDSFSIPNSVKTIGESAFWGSKLSKIDIPYSVNAIGKLAFANCSKLENIEIPFQVTTIEETTFFSCSNLKIVVITNNVKTIGNGAFFSCDSLNDVYYTGSKEQFKDIYIDYNNKPLTNANIHYMGESTTTTSTTIRYSTISTTVSTKKTFLVSTLLSKASSSNITKNINEGDSYQAIITPYSGYELSNVLVKMGNIDVTPSFSKSSCIINIPKVTGDISIIAVTVMKPEESSTVESSTEEISTTIPTVATTKTTVSTTIPTVTVTKTTVPTTIKPTVTAPKPTPKKSQTISAKSFTKTYGAKAFKIGAKAKTKLSYKSGDNKVATVSSSGKVTIKGIGKVTITITAKGNSVYKPATKKITITINPKPVTKITVKTDSKKSAQISWSKPAKVSGCQISFSYKKNFKEGERIDQVLYKNKILYKGIKRNAYFRIRAFTKYKNVKYYSSWTVKAIKFK